MDDSRWFVCGPPMTYRDLRYSFDDFITGPFGPDAPAPLPPGVNPGNTKLKEWRYAVDNVERQTPHQEG